MRRAGAGSAVRIQELLCASGHHVKHGMKYANRRLKTCSGFVCSFVSLDNEYQNLGYIVSQFQTLEPMAILGTITGLWIRNPWSGSIFQINDHSYARVLRVEKRKKIELV